MAAGAYNKLTTSEGSCESKQAGQASLALMAAAECQMLPPPPLCPHPYLVMCQPPPTIWFEKGRGAGLEEDVWRRGFHHSPPLLSSSAPPSLPFSIQGLGGGGGELVEDGDGRVTVDTLLLYL